MSEKVDVFRGFDDMSRMRWGRRYDSWDEYYKGFPPDDNLSALQLILGAMQRIADAAESIDRQMKMTPYERELHDQRMKEKDDIRRARDKAKADLHAIGITASLIGSGRWYELLRSIRGGKTIDSLKLMDEGAADMLGFVEGTKIRARFERWQVRARKKHAKCCGGTELGRKERRDGE